MKYKSLLLQDTFEVLDGHVIFDSGVFYKPDEIKEIEDATEDTKILAHKLKYYFDGGVKCNYRKDTILYKPILTEK